MSETNLISGIPLVFFYHRLNRYSFNALAGALDSDPVAAEWPISLPKTAEELRSTTATLLARHNQIIVALSVLTPQAVEIRNLVRELRSDHASRVTILAGGPHAAADPANLLESGVDIAFRGEAEAVFPTLLKRLMDRRSIQDIAGVAFRRGDEEIVNPRPAPVDINAFSSFSTKRMMLGPIEITRGCPFTCSYCQTSHIFGVRPRHRSIENIVGQAAAIRSKNGKVVRLLSPNAFSYGSADGRQLNLDAMCELLRALRETVSSRGKITFGYFPSEVRPEHVVPETLQLLRRYADNDEIVIGAQSGSSRLLEACHRSHDVECIRNAVSWARKFGYKVIVDFIFGLPGETEADIGETVSVMLEISRLGARIHPHAFVPLPQTAFSAEPPGTIPPLVMQTLERLSRERSVYGDCMAQHRMAQRIYHGL
jgi:B12-binding domain/radical SAM domain protein